MLDIVSDDFAVFRVRADDSGVRTVEHVHTDDTKTLAELGVRPSSIATTNCLVCMEGLSDAIYRRHWLRLWAPDVIEWRDYSFAFFGGALLAHADIDDSDSLVRLLRVNPSFFLIADSYRESPDKDLGNKYLDRLANNKQFADRFWISDGYEIESYVPDAVLRKAYGGETDNPTEPLHVVELVAEPGAPLRRRLEAWGASENWNKKKVELARRSIAQAAENDVGPTP